MYFPYEDGHETLPVPSGIEAYPRSYYVSEIPLQYNPKLLRQQLLTLQLRRKQRSATTNEEAWNRGILERSTH
jgi:hypothetical protein